MLIYIGKFSKNFEHKIDHNSKNINLKHGKIIFTLRICLDQKPNLAPFEGGGWGGTKKDVSRKNMIFLGIFKIIFFFKMDKNLRKCSDS